MFLGWLRRKDRASQTPPQRSPRGTTELRQDVLAESARRQDLFALLELFLVTRVQNELTLEEKRAEVTLKQAEAKAQTELKLTEIREQRRQLRASQATLRNRTHPRDALGRILPNPRLPDGGCAVCTNPADPHLTVEMIRAHHAGGHGNGGIPASR
jgi:hypothetical protein